MDEPKTTRGRRTRAAIIETAAELMYQRGVRATSLDDVLAAAGCGKSQLYHYFTGRAELLAAIIDYQLQRILGDQGSYELETWKGLRAWLDALVTQQQQQGFRGCPLGSLVSELLAEDDRLRETVAAAYARWEDELRIPLTQMRQAGKLAPGAQPDALARHLLAAIQGGYLLSTVRQDPRPMREALDAAYAHLRANR
jgi:TetR/AcrR family transcriptional regulator, transcriptional repressor for nem operon